MAAARKCDRCGKLFMPDISINGHRHNFVRLNTYYVAGALAGSDIHKIDLCNECNQSLEEWIAREEYSDCDECEYFGRPSDAPETVKKDCMWEMVREEKEPVEPPCMRREDKPKEELK